MSRGLMVFLIITIIFSPVAQLATTVCLALTPLPAVPMALINPWRPSGHVTCVQLAISVTTPCLLSYWTTPPQCVPWDPTVHRELATAMNSSVLLELSTISQVRFYINRHSNEL